MLGVGLGIHARIATSRLGLGAAQLAVAVNTRLTHFTLGSASPTVLCTCFGVHTASVAVGQTGLTAYRTNPLTTNLTVHTLFITCATVVAVHFQVNTFLTTLGLPFWTLRTTCHRTHSE